MHPETEGDMASPVTLALDMGDSESPWVDKEDEPRDGPIVGRAVSGPRKGANAPMGFRA